LRAVGTLELMNYLNNIPKTILTDHLRYFGPSLLYLPKKYQNLVFKEGAEIPIHLPYICPLCLQKYIVLVGRDLNVNGEFSIDHIPPQSVGGTLEIITCKKCNNDAGGLYEAELLKKMNYEASRNNHPDAEIKTFFKAEGMPGNYTSFAKRNEDGEIILDFSDKLKKDAPFLKDWLENKSKTDAWEVKLTITRPDDKKILKAILKSAYLICFINWGYDFIFSLNGELIRDVLSGNKEYPMNFISLWLDESNLPNDIQLPLGLCIIEKPIELRTFAVNIPLKLNGYSSVATVLIPYPGEAGWNKLKEINNFQTNKPTIQISFSRVTASLPNNIFDGYPRTWSDFLSKLNSGQNVQECDAT
jgi:hypothetical protein